MDDQWNILVVDDSGTIRSMVAKTLQLADVPMRRCFQAANGEQALELLRSESVDLAFVDVNMPVMDGGELVCRMRGDPRLSHVPVVLLTSEGRSERVQGLRLESACEYLRKPVTPEKIRDVVDRIYRLQHPLPAAEVAAHIDEVFASIVQNLAWTICDPAEKAELPPVEAPIWVARMTFQGPTRGVLTLVAPESVCDMLAANVVGVEPREAHDRRLAQDVLGEVASVTCGHILTELAGEGPEFRLEGPEVVAASEAEWERALGDERSHAFVFEESCPALLKLEMTSVRQRAPVEARSR